MPNTWIYCDICKDKKFSSGSVLQQHLASRGHKQAALVLRDEVNKEVTSTHSTVTDQQHEGHMDKGIKAKSETYVQIHVCWHADHGISHLGENIDPQLPKCLKCGMEFMNHDRLNEHRLVSHPMVLCCNRWIYKDSLNKHYQDSSEHPNCGLCSAGFPCRKDLMEHFATIHSYHCDHCTSTLESPPMQDEHLWTSDPQTHPKCYYCRVGFKDLCALERNTPKSSNQPGESFASCCSCHITFGCQVSLALHFSCVHLSTSSPPIGDNIRNSVTPPPVSPLEEIDSLSHQSGTTRPEPHLSVSSALSEGDNFYPAAARSRASLEDSEAGLPTLSVLNHDTLGIIDAHTDSNPGCRYLLGGLVHSRATRIPIQSDEHESDTSVSEASEGKGDSTLIPHHAKSRKRIVNTSSQTQRDFSRPPLTSRPKHENLTNQRISHTSAPTSEYPKKGSYVCRICCKDPVDPSVLFCGHLFCHRCIVLEIQHNLSCPVCKRVVLTKLIIERSEE